MTDSMKFGPEWLRNMSADTTSSNSINNIGQTNPSAVGFGSVSSGSEGEGTSLNNTTNNNNLSNLNPSSLHNNINASNLSGVSRNTFPEFRYGREEMLLLFDRNCGIPEILPSYKHLFVERVQFPLALVPSTDEEMMQGSAPQTQRPGWLQRSPVGFSTATRGTGRVGCMERGRMRGKSIYHPVFQRPNNIFDDDQRSSAIKTERSSWAERNGGAVGGDTVVSSPSTIVNSGLGADAWNGSTPVSSPRREYSNHPRNLENWRRSRNEDGSGGEASSATFSSESGWRMNTAGFQNSHTRWGRSTSWRDDELSNSNENSGIGGNSGSGGSSITGGVGGVMMLRSNSTISTTQGERAGYPSSTGKQTSAPGVTRSTSASSSGTRTTGSGNNWPSHLSSAQISNIQGDVSTNDEMGLPEWAMENPSDIGGTFDASGAFHGAIDDDENIANCAEKPLENDLPNQSLSEEKQFSDSEVQTKSKNADNANTTSKSNKSFSLKPNDIDKDSATSSPTPSLNSENSAFVLKKSDKSKRNNNNSAQNQISLGNSASQENLSQRNTENLADNEYDKESEISSNTNLQNYLPIDATGNENNLTNINAGDYAERMMKVTDDMIEKLIMDDEDTKDDHIKSSLLLSGNKKNTQQHVFVSGLTQPQNSNHPLAISPAIGSAVGPSGPPNIGLYNMGGIMVDHPHNMAALHQLQKQHMAAVAIGLQPTPPPTHAIPSSAPTDLWLYRDPQAKVQGPFSALEMTEWYRAGYFNENLFVRRVCDTRFRPLGELIKICNGQMPFNHSHFISIDLNPSQLTPPLAPVISSQPSVQATDFVIKTLNEQQQQHEKLKGNVTAAADSLSNALKSLINSVDISQVLNMHFQALQDRFVHNQEIEIANELSKNERFRSLSAAEQEAVVRQKLQMMVLPEYLTNLTGLSNSLAALNPTAGTQLYDTIAECTKKEEMFNNNQQHPQTSTHQQRPSHHTSSSSTPFINAEDFIMKTKVSGHVMNNNNDLLNEFNLRMFLNNSSDSGASGGAVGTPNSHGHEFLNDQQQLFRATSNNTSQSPMMQMWMNSLASNQTNTLPNQQHPLVGNNQQGNGVNNQWINNPLVGIPSISLSRDQHGGGSSIIGSPKLTPASMWDVATLEQHVQVQQHQLQQQQEQQIHQEVQQQTYDLQRHLKSMEKHTHDQDINKHVNRQQQNQNTEDNKLELLQHQNSENEKQKCNHGSIKTLSINDNNEKQERQTQQTSVVSEKSQSNNNKRHSINNNAAKPTNKVKIENFVEQVLKKTEEDRRRELNEEKRRQKEERRRQQIEEEKRRLIQAEEEKRCQMQEEEKRQQQIQAQRRKALMSNANNNNSCSNNNANNSNNLGNQKSKEQQRVQSSVAPWSTQTMTTKSQGPGLAEIQKAERRERRADQQRQLEIQEKQMRALAAAAEAQDTVLKWNAAPVPVKSFAEIQAEEAKRLANEQMELQRRKEQDIHNNLVSFSSGNNVAAGNLNSSSNISSIWSGNKIWGTSANTSGFWEEPLKFNSKALTANSASSNNINNNNNNKTAAPIVSQIVQQKSIVQQQLSSIQQNKNIKKSQSVAVMQNTISSQPVTSTLSGTYNQKKISNISASTTKQTKLQKSENNSSTGGSYDNKKLARNNNAANKGDDLEAEFTNWCIKSLNNMNTKVDVPTFVSFLRDLESPYEVKDYVRMYLGESKEYIDFAKHFLERRSKYKNLQRAQNAHDDDLCKPAQAITPSGNDNNENKGKQRKIKKNKMTKLDARILGFSVTAAEGRINVGDRDYGDAP